MSDAPRTDKLGAMKAAASRIRGPFRYTQPDEPITARRPEGLPLDISAFVCPPRRPEPGPRKTTRQFYRSFRRWQLPGLRVARFWEARTLQLGVEFGVEGSDAIWEIGWTFKLSDRGLRFVDRIWPGEDRGRRADAHIPATCRECGAVVYSTLDDCCPACGASDYGRAA